MEHRGIQEYGDMEDEEYPDEFQCCVCLDIMYKPVVLACGHISCFWCVFKAMDTIQESHCPVCRNPYNHFPRICNMLHGLLLKLYPSAYKRRERQLAVAAKLHEEEKESGHASPQCKANLIDSQSNEDLDVGDSSSLMGAVRLDSNATCEGGHSIVQDSLERTLPSEVNTITVPTTSSSHNITDKANCMVKHSDQVPVTDLQCAVCKELLCRPIVLNCGHVYCEACIDSRDGVCKCPVCQSAHPNGFPSVCLVLEHFLEEHYPEEYSARQESLQNFQSAGPSGSSIEKQGSTQCSSVPKNVNPLQFSHDGTKFHPFVGCDYCGMYPIIGVRYKCKDCVEKIGFDLCEGCYNSSSKLPGRFNQQHTQDHQFLEVQPRKIIMSFESDEDYDSDVDYDYGEDFSNRVIENGVESVASLDSSDDYSQNLEDAISSPNTDNQGLD
ncbi:hypothetical protein CASFOL_021445 [Castilleja foliolosa]|uniref:E3 ubiquitin-protein ligase PRT1 n=1 Tax=Castilleja foliolosa TaxID=1961234 RepID=A0ABD3D021_9LAMI